MISVLKFLFRLLGYGFLAVAIVAGISDASSSIAQSQVYLAPLGHVWSNLSPYTLELVGSSVQPGLWDVAQRTVLVWPVWAVLAPLGMLLLWLGAKRRRQLAQFA
ncbi:hypothetical protein [Labrenzia sp. OB1]|uniref:hypothetical protein n=1 Tax=Labrenzia sp. OB1 TaxID=1561204 RepID=UPI0007B1FA06|nr:hypothetical protein [Labrenzia sp. OB1]KZM48345.1 hypothetical protein OA90_20510 [Labrenzia sp. OB1]